MGLPTGYLPATRHPWPCLLFVVPLVAAYEAGVLMLGGTNPETIRNGADHWLRIALGSVGVRFFWVPPTLLLLVFLVWTCRRWSDRPGDLVGVLSGMVIESVSFALGLWTLSRLLAPLLLQAGIELNVAGEVEPPTLSAAEPALRLVVTYLGAGIYEEAVFRLVLFTCMVGLLRFVDLSSTTSALIAGVVSAVIFSAAHHVGPYGQVYSNYLFLFRVLAGLYFAVLYQTRGFGIAVGTHACYNVMVSVA